MLKHALISMGLLLGTPVVAGQDLSVSMQRLADQNQIQLRGAQRLNAGPAPSVSNDAPLPVKIQQLLRGYAHVIETMPNGRIARVVILGPHGKAPIIPPSRQVENKAIEVPLEGSSGNKRVNIDLTGPSATVNWPMVVDTGASLVVLPMSLAGRLGVDLKHAKTIEMTTANGKLTGQRTVLKEMSFAGHTVQQIDVAFVESETLQNFGLLGMSVLKRYNVQLDGENSLRLQPRRKNGEDDGG